MTAESLTVDQLHGTRRAAIWVDLAAVAATLYANVADAPKTVAGVVLAGSAPAFLGLAIVLWHRAHGVLTGWAGRVFTLGLVAIAGMCFTVSYTHIRDLAIDNGQSSLAAALLPLVIDGTAVLSSVVVLACGREMERIRQVELDEREVERRARQAADDDARRLAEIERAEAERIAAEGEAERLRIAAETERERELLADRKAAADAVVKARKTAGRKASIEDTETAVAAFLAAHAEDRAGKGPTVKATAEALGVTTRTVQRTAAWANRNTATPPPEDLEVLDSDGVGELLDIASTTNGSTPDRITEPEAF